MKQLAFATGLLALALGANAALFHHGLGEEEQVSGDAQVLLGDQVLSVPRRFIRDQAQMGGGRLDRLDLAVAIADFSPLPPPSAQAPRRPLPDRLTITLTPAARNGPDASTQLQAIHARFFTGETWTNVGGLIMRRFRPGTPYEDRQLYLGAGPRGPFIALCPVTAGSELCSASLRLGGIDAELRFDAAHLDQWRRLSDDSTAILAAMMARQ
ncbi:MAG: hypothetical protein LCH38_02815 [Proteobacteria bacterium]|nr:hypothetical protein [Pseudomonadota bacterium]